MMTAQLHTPPLGHAALTPAYDLVIAMLTRERIWRNRLIKALSPEDNDLILDVGSGTGSLAVALHKTNPKSNYHGIDPDKNAVRRARAKTQNLGSNVTFDVGYLSQAYTDKWQEPTKIVSSLVLHQVPLAEKQRILGAMFSILMPGAAVHIADYGHQTTQLMKSLFRLTVQTLDGVEDTQPNANGIIPVLMSEAGFLKVEEHDRIPTPTGVISLYRGLKPETLAVRPDISKKFSRHE